MSTTSHRAIERANRRPGEEDDDDLAPGVPRHSSAAFAMDVISGASVGAVAGAIAGPPGAVAGAVIGSIAGVAAGLAVELGEAERREHDADLDRAIGVVEGHIGEAPEDAPPAEIGAFSAASMGISGGGHTPSEGTMQNLDD